MSIEKIKNPLTKILNRLNSLQENQKISVLDKEYLSNLMIEAYGHLQSSGGGEPQEEAPRNDVFQFEEDDTEERESKEEEEEGTTSEPEKVVRETKETPAASQGENNQSRKEEETESKSVEEDKEENISEELYNLFQVKESTELSERLSQMPINDIWNAMGLNERIFTQNELFGGDQESFRSTVQQLNQMEDFEKAKNILIHGAAQEYNWTGEGRKNIAKNFVRLIKRKFK